jgi:hypothetical protein
MRKQETPIHSFTIRLWLEGRFEEWPASTNKTRWRGHITHIPSKTRRYFEDLDDLKPFISSYLLETDGDDSSTSISHPS